MPNGEFGDSVDMTCSDDTAVALDEHLRKIHGDSWIMARGIQINPYYGWEDNVKYTIVLGLQCVGEGEVWLVSCRPPITKKPIKNLTTISQCNNPINKRTLFAVINEIIKKPQRTTKGTYHLILCLVDPTCLEHNAPRKNLPLHMFLNDYSIKNLPGVISRGDIIQVKNMVVR
ncbi:uncharacterized protein LOC121857748 [Homarus americanus]|uniref:Uncharacterized protein n=1 Tax=Homarus americanus TaxID=6706 RepID=A0A8J5NAB2_HOMAM|nr:uncharacterized protein LOC121857748 [Homarus americanus]KAG7175688.1 hypothetical protein Hamer_G026651 [Homarus americanus]